MGRELDETAEEYLLRDPHGFYGSRVGGMDYLHDRLGLESVEPVWEEDIPRCSSSCDQYKDGECLLVIGLHPLVDDPCEPAVAEMVAILKEMRVQK